MGDQFMMICVPRQMKKYGYGAAKVFPDLETGGTGSVPSWDNTEVVPPLKY
jgi:hypothetical protein